MALVLFLVDQKCNPNLNMLSFLCWPLLFFVCSLFSIAVLCLFSVVLCMFFVVLCVFFVVICCFLFVLCCPIYPWNQQCLERSPWFSFSSFESWSFAFAQILFPRGNSFFSNWEKDKRFEVADDESTNSMWRAGSFPNANLDCDFHRTWQTNHNVSRILNADDGKNVLVFCTKITQCRQELKTAVKKINNEDRNFGQNSSCEPPFQKFEFKFFSDFELIIWNS